MAKLIWVQSATNDGRVVLFERHQNHPGGEAFVAQNPVQVARTAMVDRKLAAGELVEVEAPKKVEVSAEGSEYKTKEEVEEEIQEIRRKPGRPRKDE